MWTGLIVFGSFYVSAWILVWMVTIWQYKNGSYYRDVMCFLKKATLLGFLIQVLVYCFTGTGELCESFLRIYR